MPSEQEAPQEAPPPRKKKRALFYSMIFLLVIIAIGGGYWWFFMRSGEKTSQNQEIKTPATIDNQKLLAEIGVFLVLPEGEDPTIATVTDPDALKSKEFFAGAKKGDKVIIYTKAGKAILYDPNAKKILNVAPLNLDNTANQ